MQSHIYMLAKKVPKCRSLNLAIQPAGSLPLSCCITTPSYLPKGEMPPTLEDCCILYDEEFQLHAGRLEKLFHIGTGHGLVFLFHFPGAACWNFWHTYLQVKPCMHTQKGIWLAQSCLSKRSLQPIKRLLSLSMDTFCLFCKLHDIPRKRRTQCKNSSHKMLLCILSEAHLLLQKVL